MLNMTQISGANIDTGGAGVLWIDHILRVKMIFYHSFQVTNQGSKPVLGTHSLFGGVRMLDFWFHPLHVHFERGN